MKVKIYWTLWEWFSVLSKYRVVKLETRNVSLETLPINYQNNIISQTSFQQVVQLSLNQFFKLDLVLIQSASKADIK